MQARIMRALISSLCVAAVTLSALAILSPPMPSSRQLPDSGLTQSGWVSATSVQRESLALGLILALWLFSTVWMRPLGMPDEGRYVGVALEMARSGDWLTPTLNGLPYFHKPPLFYWITALSLSAFGNVEWAARLASLLGAMLCAGSVYLLLRRWMPERLARWYLPVLATTPIFYGGAQYANHDMLVAGFISAAIALAADAALSMQAGRGWRWQLAGGWVAAALGLLSKGLIGIVLPGGVIFFWMLLSGRWRQMIRLFWWPGPLLFLVVGAPWFLLMQRQFPDFLHYFFVYQHFQRFSQGGFNNPQPLWFFPAVLCLSSLPWAPWLLARWRVDRSNAGALPDDTTKAIRLLLWTWVVLITVFFSIPSSKLVGYVLPVVPPLSALIAEAFVSAFSISNRWRIALLLLAGGLCIGGVIAFTQADDSSSAPLAAAYRQNAKDGEPLVFVRTYRFDVPFYAGLRDPVPVISEWNEPITKDSWPKELADASRFRPALGQQVLVDVTQMTAFLCRQPVSWVIVPADYAAGVDALKHTTPVARNRLYVLLRVDASGPDLHCR
ncbi:MAG: glycosyltransferase family 39 protein [Oxalobacteraceae bacterium]|nr:glycosyltransferase family 39 protein [Oxalobacteraceae bacterium]